MTTHTRALQAHQRGIALIVVLWMLTLLAAIAASFSYATRTDTIAVRNGVATTEAKALADAGVHRFLYEDAKPFNDPERWIADGRPHEFEYRSARIKVQGWWESAKLDVNTAPDELMRGFFVSQGLTQEQAAALVDAIADWRDADALRRPNGAEETEYTQAGLAYKPANTQFQSIEELQLVLGMTPSLYRRIQSFVTVYSRQPGFDTTIASRELLLAVPNVTQEMVDTYIAQREAARALRQPVLPFPQGVRFHTAAASAQTVRSQATLEDGTTFVREAVAARRPDPKRPFVFLAWRDGYQPVSGQPNTPQPAQ